MNVDRQTMWPGRSWALLILLAVPVSHAPAASQVPVQIIQGEPVCSDCVLERDLVVTLSDSLLPMPAGMIGHATVLSDGRTLVAPFGGRSLFLADESGTVVREIGRAGSGPGEYMMPTLAFELPAPVAGYVVVDALLNRLTYLTEEFEVDRTVPLGQGRFQRSPVVLDDGSILLNAEISTRESVGHPVHLLSPEGALERSFGGTEGVFLGGSDGELGRVVGAGADSTVWIAHYDRYVIERWSLEGRLLERYERRGEEDWLPGTSQTWLQRIVEDEQGRLWVHLLGFGEARQTIVEVLDPRRGKVVATRRWPGMITAPARGGFFFLQEPRGFPDGLEYFIDVWSVSLREP